MKVDLNIQYSTKEEVMEMHPTPSSVPNLCEEFRETIRCLVSDIEPTTVTHALLLERHDPYTKEGIAAAIGRPTYEVEGTLAALEEEGWLLRFTENCLEKIVLRAPTKHQPSVLSL